MVNHRYEQEKYLDEVVSQQSNSTLRVRVYITSFLSVASFGAIISVFVMIKDRLNRELHLEEDFLSYLDNLFFIGKILGTLSVLLLPNKTPKRTYFLICALSSLCQLLIPLSVNFPSNIARGMMLCGMLGLGLSKSYVLTPFLFLSEYFNKPQDKSILTIWNSLDLLGDIAGVGIAWVGVYQLDLRWDYIYDFCVTGYFIFAVIFYFSVDEISFDNSSEECFQKNGEQYPIQDEKSLIEKLINKINISYKTLKPFYTHSLSFLWCLDFCLQASFISFVIFWFPFYFVQHQFGFTSTFIIVSFHLCSIIGTVGFQWALKKFQLQNQADKASICLIIGEIILLSICAFIIQPVKENAGLYIFMISLLGCIVGGVYNRIKTPDFLELVKEDKQLKYYAIYSSRLVHGLFAVGFSTLIGQLMRQNQNSLFFVMIGIVSVSLIVYSTRKFLLEDKTKKEKDYFEVENQLKVDDHI